MTEPEKPATPATGRTAFIIEDDATVRMILERKLQTVGFKTILFDFSKATSVASASEQLREVLNHQPIDVVCSDLALEGLSEVTMVSTGLNMVKEMRKLKKRLPILVMSASIDESALSSMKKIGATAAYSKTAPSFYQQMVDAAISAVTPKPALPAADAVPSSEE